METRIEAISSSENIVPVTFLMCKPGILLAVLTSHFVPASEFNKPTIMASKIITVLTNTMRLNRRRRQIGVLWIVGELIIMAPSANERATYFLGRYVP